jgi:spore germination protein
MPLLSRANLSKVEHDVPTGYQPAYQVSVWAPYAGFLEQQTLIENAGVVVEVNFVWYTLREGGKIEGSVLSSQALAAAREAGLRVVPSIANSGFDRDIVLQAIGDPADRARHVQELAALVEENGYDGIDIDYESLAAEDREVFSLFIEELAAALHDNGRILSIAVHAKTDDAGTWGGPAAQDWRRLGAVVDEFKIMTYDYHYAGGEAGPIAPLEWVGQVLDYAATVVPPELTWVGVHFYGYDWLGNAAEGLEWQQVVKRAGQNAAQIQRDEPGEAWFTYDGGRHTLYFTDAQALDERLAYVLARHPQLAGIAIWRLGGEDPGNWAVIRAQLASDGR